jgi:hypothetical protein
VLGLTHTCWARLLVVPGAAVGPCHQVAVGGAGGGEFVVAVLEVLASVEELLFEFGDPLTEGADFVGSGDAASWKTCSPRTSDSRSLSLVLWCRSRSLCARRLARSASSDRWLVRVPGG